MYFSINGKRIAGIKSTASHPEGQECLHVAADGEIVKIAESDNPSEVVTTSRANFAAFVKGAKAGEFDKFTVFAGERV